MSKLVESAPKIVGEPAEHIYGKKVKRFDYTNLELEEKIIVTLYNNPIKTVKIFQKINGNSPHNERHPIRKVKKTLMKMEDENKVYKIRKGKKKNWKNFKWFLCSNFIVSETVKSVLEEILK